MRCYLIIAQGPDLATSRASIINLGEKRTMIWTNHLHRVKHVLTPQRLDDAGEMLFQLAQTHTFTISMAVALSAAVNFSCDTFL